jgi:hypothetical protein
MATDDGERSRRPIEPLVSVVSDSVALGYSALEHVVEGLRESLRIQSGRGGAQQRPPARPTVPLSSSSSRARGATAGPRGPSLNTSAALLGDLAAIAAELFGRAGAVAAEVADTVSERVGQPAEALSIPELTHDAVAGETTTLEFAVWNTGPTALRKVVLGATDLIGAEHRSLKGAIAFRPPIVSQVGPGQSVAVEVDVAVPRRTEPGLYRGLVQAEPGDTCAVLLLNVTAAPAAPPASRRRTKPK